MKKGYKWVGLILAMVLFLFYGFGVKKTTLINRAIVVGLAIDRVEDELMVSAQILLPQSDNSKANSNNVVSAKGKTISGTLNTLSKETSMVIALSHCNLVIVGKDVLALGTYNILNYLTRNAYLSENALLVSSLEKGLDILKTKVAFSDMASFYAQRTISSYGDYLGIAKTSIKDFMLNYHSDGGANWLTIIEKKETGNKDLPKDEKEYIFDLSQTAILRKNKFMFNSDKISTEGLSYYYSKIQNGSIFIEGDKGEAIELYIIKKTEKTKVDLVSTKIKVEINLILLLKETIKKDVEEDVSEKQNLTKNEINRLKDKVGASIIKVFEESKAHNVDILDAYGHFYRKYGKRFSNSAKMEEFLQKLELEVVTRIQFK